jgi:hypothetical protein
MTHQSLSEAILVGPAIESLFAQRKDSPWPSNILDDIAQMSDMRRRRMLHAKLREIFLQIPDATVDVVDAVKEGHVLQGCLAQTYNLLADLLESDPSTRRLVLYLPLELLPPQGWDVEPDSLHESAQRFQKAYMTRWRELLRDIDVRANFVDGNILERELAPDGQPLVCKAAHLIPHLVQKGLVSIPDMTTLMRETRNDVLRESISDALRTQSVGIDTADAADEDDSIERLPEEIDYELRKLDMREALDHARGMPPARVAWERRNSEDVLISSFADRIVHMLASERAEKKHLSSLLSATHRVLRLATLRGLRIAVERLATKDRPRTERICDTFCAFVRTNAPKTSEVLDEIETLFAHWVALGLMSPSDMRSFGFELPKLDSEFATTGPLAKELAGFSGTIESIARDPEYDRLLYPVGVFFGSRLKQYARRNADLDMAVFVKPGVQESERPHIRRILAELFPNEKIDGKIVEFWLESDGDALRIRDFPDPDVFLGDSTWIHLLMGSVWLGERVVIEKLYETLLSGFLYSEGRTIMDRDARTLWLGELERDVLQYRLMHKGYRRFFPPMSGRIESAAQPDPSTFWDPGYRRLATLLFVSRVFLPQLKYQKK